MPGNGIEPLVALRRHAAQAPWSVAELAALGDRLLGAAGLLPPRPTTERTVRFYVSRGVMRPPFGRGPGSAWGYPHLVELLAARLAQQEGESLEQVAERRRRCDDAALEQFTADRLGATPIEEPAGAEPAGEASAGSAWLRHAVAPGLELHLAADHPLAGDSRRLGALLERLAREATSSAPES